MLKHIDNPKDFLARRLFGVCFSGGARDQSGALCPLMLPDTRLLIKHLKCLWQGAPDMKYSHVVP